MAIGVLFGMAESRFGNPIWPTLVGLLLVLLAARHLIGRWIAEPLSELVDDTQRAIRAQRPTKQDLEPMSRRDEIGEIARMVHELSVLAYRQRTAADNLRRTLDDRVARATREATRNLQEMAMRDALTGLGNRRFMDVHVERVFKSCSAAGADVIAVAIDMDHFKQVNDTLGHAVGDKLLQLVGHLLTGNIRKEDLAIRLGGDEFLVVMPECPIERAATFAEQVRTMFSQHVRTILPAQIKAGLSTGVASRVRDGAGDIAALLAHADGNLYEAKSRGKGVTVGA